MTARSSSASSAARRARSAASPSAARSARPAVTEQAPYDDARRAVPDDVLPDLPAPRRGRRAARGRGRRRALERGASRDDPALAREPRARDRGAAARSAASSPAARPAATAAPRSSSGSAAARNPRRLKCLHAHAAFALARPGLRARRADPRRARAALALGALLHAIPDRVASRAMSRARGRDARREWEEGQPPARGARRPATRRPAAGAGRGRVATSSAGASARPSRSPSWPRAYARRRLAGAARPSSPHARAPRAGRGRSRSSRRPPSTLYARGAIDYAP